MSNTLDYSAVSRLSMRLRVAGLVAPKRVNAYLNKVGDDLLEEIRRRAPVKTGNLRDHARKMSEPGLIKVGIYNVDYTRYVVEGTKPHEIRPKNATVLRFQVGGRTFYARRVHHPGTKPNTFISDSVRTALRENHGMLTGLKFGVGPGGQ